MQPVLSILVASLDSRRPLLDRLMAGLEPQTRGQPVEIRVRADGGAEPLGAKRQQLLNQAAGQYVAYVDDDDLVSPDYVARLLDACACNPDVVTFDLRRSSPSSVQEWRFSAFIAPSEEQRRGPDGRFVYRANHLCPTRREIAQAVPFIPIGCFDDVVWYHGVAASGLVRNAIHVPAVLYLYLWNPALTAAQTPAQVRASKALLRAGVRIWRHVPTGRICIEAGQRGAGGRVAAYTPGGGRELIAQGDLQALELLKRR